MPHLYPLTSLRFFAAAVIVAGHILPTIVGTPGDSRYGLGVSFFFVLSGFILTYQYRDFSRHSVKAFYVARFARLWPIHLVTFLLVAIILQPQLLLSPMHAMTAMLNLLLLHAWLPISGLVFSWNAPSWSISDELWFYLLFPFLARTKRLWAWLVVLIAIAAFIIFSFPIAKATLFEFSYVHAIMQHPAVRVVEFAVGVFAGRLFNAGLRIKGPAMALEATAIALMLLYGLTTITVQGFITSNVHQSLGVWYNQSGGLLVFAFAIFIFAQSDGPVSRLLAWRGLVLLGEISFSTYMVHQIIIRYAFTHRWSDAMGAVPATIVVLTLVYLSSWVLWRTIEMPCRRWIIAKAQAS
ncbi:acyltransferase family protein [Mesorhizobium australicum]|uniref:acyltransferase family protein n=1 Tax=Mesorhizobium australicum TaxID=536018 RepID=UPI001FCD33D7|nr:acyltransferase [Mesorhizobium australicum]